MDTHDLRSRLHFEIRNGNFTSMSCDGHARSPQKVALGNQKSQLYQHFPRWTHTHTRSPHRVALRNPKSQIYQHSVMDARDLRRGLHSHFEIRNRNFTCIPCHQHARFPQRVALRNQKSQLYLHSVPSTRTISAEGSLFETMLQKYCACHEIMSRGHTKCCTGHAKASSSKNATPLRNRALPRKMQSF